MHTYTYAYIHTYVHAYTHTHTYRNGTVTVIKIELLNSVVVPSFTNKPFITSDIMEVCNHVCLCVYVYAYVYVYVYVHSNHS